MIEFLPFGNVTVAALILAGVALTLALVNQLFLWAGRLALSLDNPNAPDILKENWVWGKLPTQVLLQDNLIEDDGSYYLMSRYGFFYDRKDSDTWSKEYRDVYCKFSSKEKAASNANYIDNFMPNWRLWGGLLLIDLAILWLQYHFFSAIWVLGTVGVVLMLRYISSALWNTQSKTEDNTDRIEKIENTLNNTEES